MPICTNVLVALLSLSSVLASLSPDGAVVLGSAGLALIAWELNRPGSILPGAFGLLCFLLAASALARFPVQPGGLLLLLASLACLFANLRWKLPVWLLVLASSGIAEGLHLLIPRVAFQRVHAGVATVCGLLLGSLGAVLSRIALRARRAKKVN